VKYKLMTDAEGNKGIAPIKMTKGSVGYDLAVPADVTIGANSTVVVPLLVVLKECALN